MNTRSTASSAVRSRAPHPTRNKIAHAVFCALAALTFASAHASEASDATTAAADPQQGKPADANADTSASLETVTVTANKRSESLQKVAMSISAIDGKDMTNAGRTSPT